MPTLTIDNNLFASCDSIDEVLTTASIELSPEELDLLLAEGDFPRQMLRRAQQKLKRAGMRDLAALVAKHAKKAKPAPMTFKRRWGAR